MSHTITIYLAGSIKKNHEKSDEFYWTDEDRSQIRNELLEYKISFLNPAFRTDDLSDQRSVFGRDMSQVYCSDLVFVDARDRRGLGVGAEMMWAKFHKIPVLTLAPKDSHYNKSNTTVLGVPVENWIHPFVELLSDAIVEDLEAGAEWIRKLMENPSLEIKGVKDIEAAMKHYLDSQLSSDEPMKALVFENQKIQSRLFGLAFMKRGLEEKKSKRRKPL